MPQATVKSFDPDSGTGTVLLDDQREVAVPAEAFAASGLEELRLGQRVRLDYVEGDDGPRATWVRLISV